ncbi:HAD family hydrolase [Streptomyces sp. NPDC056785]|uniref:HAD family hydrolase n=1 Tax=Streptomyces sp. NPDC056785 TaxID=3345944 RepID=UPI0036A4B5F6
MYVDGLARSARCFPGARQGLEALRGSGWTIGIATNGAGDVQRAKLAATGLAPLFDGICVSGDVGARKPERRLFEAAATEYGASLNADGWMVGDNPVTDMGGARAEDCGRSGWRMAVNGPMASVSPTSWCQASWRPSRSYRG